MKSINRNKSSFIPIQTDIKFMKKKIFAIMLNLIFLISCAHSDNKTKINRKIACESEDNYCAQLARQEDRPNNFTTEEPQIEGWKCNCKQHDTITDQLVCFSDEQNAIDDCNEHQKKYHNEVEMTDLNEMLSTERCILPN